MILAKTWIKKKYNLLFKYSWSTDYLRDDDDFQ